MIPGITQKMLTQTLKSLEKDGLLTRKIYATVPLKVEYSLTTLGRKLTKILNTLADWAENNMEQVMKARKNYVKTGVASPLPTSEVHFYFPLISLIVTFQCFNCIINISAIYN